MLWEEFLARHTRTEGSSLRKFGSVLALVIVIVFLVSMVGCKRHADAGRDLNTKFMPRIRSLSVSGLTHASLIPDNTRDLRLSTDGGKTWQVIPSTAVADKFECATWLDDKRGWAVNHQGHIFATHSGGATWTKISELKDFTGANQIEFLNENDGWIREFLSIWRTRDGGATWHETLSTVTPGVAGQPTSMFALNADVLVSSGSGGQVYVTKDGGETWRIETPLAGTNIEFNDVWFVDQTHGWLTGYQILVAGKTLRPLLLETTNGGDSWKEITVAADIRPSSVCFVGDKGWLAGSQRIVNDEAVKLVGVLLQTEDAGKNWTPVQFGPDEPFFTDVRFTDSTHGWLVGRDSLFSTADGGKTWKQVFSLLPIP